MTDAFIEHKIDDLQRPGGVRLVWQSWSVRRPPKAVLAVVHGYGEHCARYGFLVDAVVPRGYDVFAYDLRGHGRSSGRRGHVARFGEYLDDTRSFLAEVRRRRPLAPLFLVGHSFGGLIAAALVEQDDAGLAGLVLSSPFVGMRLEVPPRQLKLARFFSRVYPTMAMVNPLRNEDLSHDPDVVAAAAADPLNHRVTTTRWAAETAAAMPAALAAAERLRLPLLLLYGDDDPIADPAACEELFARAGSGDKARHCYRGHYHETFNEVGREEVFADLAAWLDDRLERRTSG